jgi:DNA-binding LacI/PurR family transcriptional regulator
MIRRGVTALLCFDNQFSMRILHLLRTMDIRVPEDVSLIGYDDYSFAQFCSPPLTAIRQPIFNLGAYAGQHIINLLRDETTPCNLSLEPQLIIRQSVGPAKQA